jgi:predicted lipid-binding transport protein (Tim44 family)
MTSRLVNVAATAMICLFVAVASVSDAYARAGGGSSMGSRGSRSYSRPMSPTQPSPSQPRYTPTPTPTPAPSPYRQPAPGGFFRSLAGGIVGGMIGGMLFRSLGFGGWGGGGGGIGLFDILLLAGIAYLIYRMVRGRRESPATYQSTTYGDAPVAPPSVSYQESVPAYGAPDLATGLGHIRQMDAGFDEGRFRDQAMDIFFRIQGAWMNRDLAPVAPYLTDEMRRILQADVDNLLREHRVNRLENIAVRSVEAVEAWQEEGRDYITTLIYANLLDYTTDDTTGAVVAGSRTEPVKFEEYWTFARSVGPNPWQLSAIEQK